MKHLKIITKSNWMHIYLNRPKKKNALNAPLIKELSQTFLKAKQLVKKNKIKGVMLKGEGSSFCSGADLKWISTTKTESILFDLLQQIENCPVPVIAHVHGFVFGGGIGLTSVCDFVSAQSSSQFCFSEIKWGLIPSMIAPFVLKRTSFNFAKTYMLMGNIFDAKTALKNQLVNFIGSKKACQNWEQKLIRRLNTFDTLALQEAKILLHILNNPLSKNTLRATAIQNLKKRKKDPFVQKQIENFLNKNKV